MRALFTVAGWFAAAVTAGLTRATAKAPAGVLLAGGLAAPTAAFTYLYRRRRGFRRWVLRHDPRWTTLLQTSRTMGFVFLVAWRRGSLPAIQAIPTAVSDMSIGLTAPIAATRTGAAFRLWHLAGFSFLVMSVGLGVLTSPPLRRPDEGPTSQAMAVFPLSLVPTFLGPAVLLAHLAALVRAERDWEPARR